jgi:hypothetical protein
VSARNIVLVSGSIGGWSRKPNQLRRRTRSIFLERSPGRHDSPLYVAPSHRASQALQSIHTSSRRKAWPIRDRSEGRTSRFDRSEPAIPSSPPRSFRINEHSATNTHLRKSHVFVPTEVEAWTAGGRLGELARAGEIRPASRYSARRPHGGSNPRCASRPSSLFPPTAQEHGRKQKDDTCEQLTWRFRFRLSPWAKRGLPSLR